MLESVRLKAHYKRSQLAFSFRHPAEKDDFGVSVFIQTAIEVPGKDADKGI